MRTLVGERAGDAAVDLYVQLKPLAAPSQLYFEMLSDRTRRQSILIAEMKAAQNEAKAYLYQLMWNTPVMDGLLRSPHSLDLPMIFDIAHGRALEALHRRGAGRRSRGQGHELVPGWSSRAPVTPAPARCRGRIIRCAGAT